MKSGLSIFISFCLALGACSYSSRDLLQVEKIMERAPDSALCLLSTLTRKEITCCCLSLLQITHVDVLTLIEYKQTSYSKFKQRLAKKMNLNDAAELTRFLEQKVENH